MGSEITVGITTFGRATTVVETVSNLRDVPVLVNVNDGDAALAEKLKSQGFQTIQADEPRLFWEGISSVIRGALTEWVLLTSDEDPVLVENLLDLETFAREKKAGVVATPVYGNRLVKPWPASWVDRIQDENPLSPSSFHDISGYLSGTLLHRLTALEFLPLVEKLAPDNEYVRIYTVPTLVALMGLSRPAHIYSKPVVSFGEQLESVPEPGGYDYAASKSRASQKQHLDQFLAIVREIDSEYGAKLSEARVYEDRGWAS